ncbi:pro-sigmaK processing inhibitor BofA family protein [Brevibacillus sp. SYSU BS000544]|uniref:pro-sigmaK processing inhibitor BofA family protein n=1 Tax=Brevibacillus sp. SYSU BS000544 TaxID=3416443 RepID=UPI003CE513A7
MGTEWIVAFIVIGVLLLVAASKSMTKPLRWVGLLALNVVIGAILLFFANLIGEMAGYHIPINPVTAVLTGFLRIPGVLALIGIKMFIM